MPKTDLAHTFGFIGGIITLIVGIIAIISPIAFIKVFEVQNIYLGIWGAGCGILILVGAAMEAKEIKSKVGAIIMTIFGAFGLITFLYSIWVIGPALALIGGIIALARK